jgi:TPR repeat protein
VGALLRCLDEAARLEDRSAAVRFVDACRFASGDAQRIGLAHLQPWLANDPEDSARYHHGLLLYHLCDRVTSLIWHEGAAAAGNPDAMFELYVYYSTGVAVDVDDRVANRWLAKAAARNPAARCSASGRSRGRPGSTPMPSPSTGGRPPPATDGRWRT